jgi:hypothetical protein
MPVFLPAPPRPHATVRRRQRSLFHTARTAHSREAGLKSLVFTTSVCGVFVSMRREKKREREREVMCESHICTVPRLQEKSQHAEHNEYYIPDCLFSLALYVFYSRKRVWIPEKNDMVVIFPHVIVYTTAPPSSSSLSSPPILPRPEKEKEKVYMCVHIIP